MENNLIDGKAIAEKIKEGVIMFDLNKLGDMTKLASQAKKMQEEQERQQREQKDMLSKISKQLDEVLSILKRNN